jgi:class 3 adenylate cyclase/tetratricopeptide (TPR) repeat protein
MMGGTVECRQCGQDNAPDQQFCGACGALIMVRCGSCAETNPARFRFCGRCGAALQPGAPRGRALIEERRWATVVFADLSGFTALSERMDPEDVRALVDACTARLGEIVQGFGGAVDKVIGDELMAVFGAPTAYGDDAERAVRAALEMHQRAAKSPEEFGALALRIGINTGEVIFAPVGPGDARSFTVLGDPVNVASRLCGAVDPRGTLVGEETWRATRRAISYAEMPPCRLKGKDAPLAVWLALSPVVPAAQVRRFTAPMVGREQEVRILRATWDRVIAERRPHLVTVLGPPGIGKTRLAQEFGGLVEAQGGQVLRGRCLPYGERTGYRAFAQQVKEAAGILDTDPGLMSREKLERSVAGLVRPDELVDIATRLAVLIGLEIGAVSVDKGPLFASARRFVEALTSERPTVFEFEDVHWADRSLLDLLDFLAGRCLEAPVLFLAMARPELLEVRPGWGGGLSSSTTLDLKPLSVPESSRLVASLLPPLAESSITNRMVDRVGGNPLFIEELVATFRERASEIAGTLPVNVQAIIAARVDALPPSERQVLFDATVVGKVFWRGALVRSGSERDLDEVLDALEAKDLIRREPSSEFEGDRQFLFKHMLIREVAYATLPRAVRRDRHAAVARFIEDSAPRGTEQYASLLAHHWREAGDIERTIGYLIMAAEYAGRSWAKAEAASLYLQALELLPANEETRRATLRLSRANAILETSDFPTAAAELDAVLPELEGEARAEALLGRARAAFWLADEETAASAAQEAIALGEALDDPGLRARGRAAASHAHMMEGSTDPARTLGEAALRDWPSGVRLPERAVHCAHMGGIHYWTGGYQRAVACAEAGYRMGMEIQSVEPILAGGANLGMALTGLGRHREALTLLEQVVAQGLEFELVPRLTSRAMNIWAGTLREICQWPRARQLNEQAVEVAQRATFGYAVSQGRIDLLFADLEDGEIGAAEGAWPALWEAALASKSFHRWLMPGRLTTARAQIELGLGRTEAAAETAVVGITAARRNGRLKYEVASRLVLGAALAAMGRLGDAAGELRQALGDADRLGHPPSRWRAALALTRILAAMGNDNGAATVASTAADTVRQFADTLAEPDRATFLGASTVAEVLSVAS